jgi:kynurenine formamidase
MSACVQECAFEGQPKIAGACPFAKSDECRTVGWASRRGGARAELAELPRYRELPIHPNKPPHSAWGVFGDEDQLGTVNLLTPDRVRRAAALVRKGSVFSLNWDVDKPDPPLLGRGSPRHTIKMLGEGTDDYFDNFYPQLSSQLDALSHIGHLEHGFYNGCTRAEITGRPGSRNGIDNYARKGIAGRFVLADLDRYRRRHGGSVRCAERDTVSVDEIDATLAEEGVSLDEGDILLLRFGWIGWYEQADQAARDALLVQLPEMPNSPGLAQEERTAEWLWDHRVAMVAADCLGLEALPADMETFEGFLHFRLIPLLGMALGELFVLDPLAEDCADDGVYEGLLTAAPINKVGGSGSPANALAIK